LRRSDSDIIHKRERQTFKAEGGEAVKLSQEARAAFKQPVKPLHGEARMRFGDGGFRLIPKP
jgi:hypothetical protein